MLIIAFRASDIDKIKKKVGTIWSITTSSLNLFSLTTIFKNYFLYYSPHHYNESGLKASPTLTTKSCGGGVTEVLSGSRKLTITLLLWFYYNNTATYFIVSNHTRVKHNHVLIRFSVLGRIAITIIIVISS